jgi:hypothetical protein
MAFKIDNEAAGTEPTRPAAATMGFFSNLLRTTVPDWWLNMIQNEIASAVTKFGLTLDKTNDNQLGLAIAAAVSQGKSDTQYVDMEGGSGSEALSQSDGEAFVYTISAFDNAGSTLNPADIRMVHVRTNLLSNDTIGGSEITATYGGVADIRIGRLSVNSAGGITAGELGTTVSIPVNKGQTDMTITNIGPMSRDFKIVGVTVVVSS